MSVRSDVTRGRNWRWEWRPEAGDPKEGKTMSEESGGRPRARDAE